MKKKIILFLSFITLLVFTFTVKANNNINVNIYASYSDRNDKVHLSNGSHARGTTFSFEAEDIRDEKFAYWIVDGAVDLEREASTEFVATSNLEAVAIFHGLDNYAISFVDHNGSLIETKYVELGGSLVEPTNLPNKYGYNHAPDKWQLVHGLDNSFENILENKVFKLKYVRDESISLVNVKFYDQNNDEVVNDYNYNEVVTLEKGDIPFAVYWKDKTDGTILSFDINYYFSALYDREIELVRNTYPNLEEERPLVSLSKNLKTRPGYITKVGQIYLPDGYELVETGYLVSNTNELLELNNAPHIVKATSIHSVTNEFLTSINNYYTNIRGYLTYKHDGVIETVYSTVTLEYQEFTEGFEGDTELTASYTANSFTGAGNSIWSYGESRNEGGGSDYYAITNKGLMLRRGSDSHLTITFLNGLNKFSFDFRKAFTGGTTRTLEVYINNTLINEYTVQSGSGADDKVQNVELNNLNYMGEVVVKIKPKVSTNHQITLDNFVWGQIKGLDLEEVDNYIVSFDTNGGNLLNNLEVKDGKYITLPTPEKFGYIFEGWYLANDYSGSVLDDTYQVVENTTLYAKWEQISGTFNVTYVLNNGSNDVVHAVSASSYLTPPSISNGNLILAGWYKDDDFDEVWDFDSDYVIENITLYALWVPQLSERTKIGAIRGQVQDDPTYNNAVELQIEPSYFHVVGHKSGNNRPGIYDELRFYTGTALTFTIHESFVINKIVISNNSNSFTVTSGETTLSSLSNLNIQTFKITNGNSNTVYTDYIEIFYYQIGPDVVKEDDINRPTFDVDGINLYEKIVGDTFTNPILIAFDVEDLDIVGTVDLDKSDSINPNQEGIYYIHYYAEDSDGNIGIGYITVIYRDSNAMSSYYGNLLSKPDNQLESSITTLVKSTINEQTYASAKDVLEIADRDPNNFNNVWLIYNGASIKGEWQSPNYAREHVWAKSAFGGIHSITSDYDGNGVKFTESYRGAASDLHNLRAINPSVNSTHSNFEFGDNNGLVVGEWRLLSLSSRPHNPYTPGKENDMTTNVFYPGKDHQGDVARIILYMMLMWDLTPREDIDMLVDWHLSDPVDNFEIIRNEVIYSYQGNRNPFIDYPQLVERTFVN